MTVTVRQLAEWIGGEVLGDAEQPIAHARTLAEAEPGDITFVSDERHLSAWHASKASAAVVPMCVAANGRPVIRVADPLMAFASIYQHLRGTRRISEPAIDPSAVVHPTATLGIGVRIGALAVVGEGSSIAANSTIHPGAVIGRFCTLGCEVVIYPRAVLYDDCRVGDRVIIHAGSVIGAEGFGYRFQNGRHEKVPQLGWVELESDVEIGACSTVDRGTFGPTRIGRGTKLDNHVLVGHNCQIGRHNILAGQVGIAGSTTTGDYVVMGGQTGVNDHVVIGDRAVIAAKSGVTKDVPPGITVLGFPAAPQHDMLRRFAALHKLPDALKDLHRIKAHLGFEDV